MLDYNELFSRISRRVDRDRLYDDVESLWRSELPQTFKAYADSAECALAMLRRAGVEDAEIVNFPADGKTAYQDKRMPLAWDATIGKLTVKRTSLPFDDPVVADYRRHPFHLVKGSVGVQAGGRMVGIVTEGRMFAGESVRDALVVCSPGTRPVKEILSAALDLGALGLITDYYVRNCPQAPPGAVGWVNACTEGVHWHVQAEDRPFVCFSVAAPAGDRLRQAAEAGELTALVECDGRRHEGTLPGVTGLLPGRQEKELWLMAHLYEPLSDDNATGVAAAVEIVRVLGELVAAGELPMPEFSIRLVFALEMYGFAAFAEHFGGFLGDRAVGAVNLDSLVAGNPGQKLHVYPAAPGSPFFGNALLEKMLDDLRTPVAKFAESGWYADDTHLGDGTVGLPTVWLIGREKAFWHNSMLTMQTIDREVLARTCATIGTWVAAVATLGRESLPEAVAAAGAYALRHIADEYRRAMGQPDAAERMRYRLRIDVERLNDFRDVADTPEIGRQAVLITAATERLIEALKQCPATEDRHGRWFDYAATVVPSRATIGFPYDQAGIPPEKRRGLPNSVIYGPLARILSNMDGRKNLQRLVLEAEWEEQQTFAEEQIRKQLSAIMHLGDHGYLEVAYRRQTTRTEIVAALRQVGVKAGDCLFVHSAVSAFGRIDGGEDAIIEALLEAVGPAGTVLMPTFTRPFIYFDGMLNRSRSFRPFDMSDPSQVCVGSLPRAFLRREGVVRSVHPSHSAAGLGPLAEACLRNHRESDPPTGDSSPFAGLAGLRARILYLGCGLAPSTFLHFIETEAGSPYLKSALCAVKDETGGFRTVLIPRHLPGHRDFYSPRAEECKFFRKAAAMGLEVKETVLGLGRIQAIEAAPFRDIGMRLLEIEPDILLCDDPGCLFCAKYHSRGREDFR